MDTQPLSPGQQIAGYTLESLIGRGGMGEVYRGVDLRLARAVAVKVLAPEYADDPGFKDRTLSESRIAAGLDHPNVIPIYSAGDDDGHVYIAMRLVEGSDLRAILKREGCLDPSRAIALMAQVAEALDAAHAAGLVHRDVKPSNVLIDDQRGREHCYLADFGITTSVRDSAHSEVSQRLMGTLAYIAPEQIRGDPLDGRADVYSLGCMLFECLTGEVPFVSDSDMELVFAHLEQPPPRLGDRRAELPAALDPVIASALAKDPDERPETCRELVDRARDALGLERPRPRRRPWLVAALAVLVAAAVIAAVLITRPSSSPAAARTGSVVRIDPTTGSVTGRYPVSQHPTAIEAGSRVWAADYLSGSLYRIVPSTGETERIPAIGYPRDLAMLNGTVYVASDGPSLFGGNVTRYDVLTGARIDGVDVVPCSIGAGEGVVYTAGCPDVNRLTTGPAQMRVATDELMPYPDPTTAAHYRSALIGLAVGEGSVWVLGDALDPRVFRVAPSTGKLLQIYDLPAAPEAIAVGAGHVWITSALADRLYELDPHSGRVVRTIPTGRGTDGVAVGAGAVWVACAVDRQVWRIDPGSGRVTGRIDVADAPHGVAVGGNRVWVTVDPA